MYNYIKCFASAVAENIISTKLAKISVIVWERMSYLIF